MKCEFNVSAILIHHTLQTASPFANAAINEVLLVWQFVLIQYDHVKLLAVVDLLLQGPPNGIIHQT